MNATRLGRTSRLFRSVPLTLFLLLCLAPTLLVAQEGECCEEGKADPKATASVPPPRIPDTPVLDQHGKSLRFYTDLVKGKTVAINFIFTTCRTICPPLTATFKKIQEELKKKHGDEIHLISVSVDPTTDVPARLKEFSGRFKAEPGWTFVTGSKPQIDLLLQALGAATPDKFDHTAMILIGNDRSGRWTRTYGLAPADEVVRLITEAHAGGPVVIAGGAKPHGHAGEGGATTEKPGDAAARYFPNNVLVTQNGKQVRFYEDLLQGKAVMINVMFTTCTSICPPMMANLSKVADYLGDRLGRDITLLSITVDPETDTPEKMKEYGKSFNVPEEGWLLLTGKKSDVDAVLKKIGAYVEDKDTHNGWLIIGNLRTGDWMKAFAMTPPSVIVSHVTRILGEEQQAAGRP